MWSIQRCFKKNDEEAFAAVLIYVEWMQFWREYFLRLGIVLFLFYFSHKTDRNWNLITSFCDSILTIKLGTQLRCNVDIRRQL